LPSHTLPCHPALMKRSDPELPCIMVAPNGARHKADSHPKVPLTIEALAETARDCFAEGARAMHFHIRDAQGRHILDAAGYTSALTVLTRAVPSMHFQITTEAYGHYQPSEMRAIVRDVVPPGVSVGLREMMPGRVPTAEDIAFYSWLESTEIAVQHICYSPDDIDLFCDLAAAADLPRRSRWFLFVLGHYSTGLDSDPAALVPFLERITARDVLADWAVCAFGQTETDCLIESMKQGGKVRVGFENSFFNRDGSIARDNAERVAEIAAFRPRRGPVRQTRTGHGADR
jgi:3-keto-5-aminohexanoate cleavage enzyme